jgi:hypothetical protein
MTAVPIHMIGDYPVLKELSPGHTYLATGAGGRRVVLKRLDDDCLFEGRLHVSIKERLQRIQEVAHGGVANLYGVERVGGHAFLVWEYVEGTALEDYLAAADARGRLPDLLPVARELVLSVEGLSRLGLVHGALHGGNIFVTPNGVRLTHLSPYLYTDPQEDARAVVDLLLDGLNKRYQPGDLPVHRLLTRAADDGYDLATLVPLLACPPDSPLSPLQMGPKRVRKRGRRRKSVLIAGFIASVGLVITVGLLWHFGYVALPARAEIVGHLKDWWTRAITGIQRVLPGRV